MPKIVVVTGSPEAGKTTILGKLDRKSYNVINIGDLMAEIARKESLASTKDELRKLSGRRELYSRLREMAFSAATRRRGKTVIDTHASVEHMGRYVPGLPLQALRLLKGLSGFIYIDAETKEILERRLYDKSRDRGQETAARIETQRLVNLASLSFCASYLNIPLHIINNRQGELRSSVKDLEAALSDLFVG